MLYVLHWLNISAFAVIMTSESTHAHLIIYPCWRTRRWNYFKNSIHPERKTYCRPGILCTVSCWVEYAFKTNEITHTHTTQHSLRNNPTVWRHFVFPLNDSAFGWRKRQFEPCTLLNFPQSATGGENLRVNCRLVQDPANVSMEVCPACMTSPRTDVTACEAALSANRAWLTAVCGRV